MLSLFGINGYNPLILSESSQILEFYQTIAGRIIGHKISGFWTAWSDNYNTWWNSAPVILEIGDLNHEVCWMKEADLAISENMIATSDKFLLDDLGEFPSHWRKNAFPDLQYLIGEKILNIELFEARLEIKSDTQDNRYWVPNGVLFMLSGGNFCICNGFDENYITSTRFTGDNHRSIRIAS